ncbi:hypothetical protein V8G54_008343 [Vigna mungo]|uniref:RHOMBOID-like protein n=1 Tax=Vigna mungo TaxID=3915 RepID=A0AAQ3P514_VIGMU
MENATEARLEAIEIMMEGMKAESAAVRRDLQQIMKTEGSSDDSSMNDNRLRVVGENDNGRTGNRGVEQKPWRKRVELPTFDGEEPLSWLNGAERFFDIQKVINDEEKVEIVYVSMERSTAYWFTFWKEKARNRSWDGLKATMINRFGGGFRGTEGTVEEFVRNFEVLMGQTRGVPEEQVVGYFNAGLREDVKGQAMRIARDVEDAMLRMKGENWNGFKSNQRGSRSMGAVVRSELSRPTTNQQGGTESVGSTRREAGATNSGSRMNTVGGSDNRGRMVRNLPYPELLKQKEEGRCFRCGGPFAPGHRCSERSLHVLLLAEDEEEVANDEVGEFESKTMELFACSAEGMTPPKTTKLVGWVGGRRMVVLIDSGASHNFVSKDLAEDLKLPVTEMSSYLVSLGDGRKKLQLSLGEAMVVEDFYLFDLGGVGIILGVAWLAKLGEMVINWRDMTMSYYLEGKRIQIRDLVKQGLPPPPEIKQPYIIKFETWKLGLIERKKIMVKRDLESGGGRTKNNKTEEKYTAHESSNFYEADTHWTSWLIPMFVVANIVVFVISMYINNCSKNNPGSQGGCVAKFRERFSFEPMQENLFGPFSSTLTKMGALRCNNVVIGQQGWRLVICNLLNTGIIHFIASMLSLVFMGIRLEQQFGFLNLGDKVVEGEEGNVRSLRVYMRRNKKGMPNCLGS